MVMNLLATYGKYWFTEWARPINYLTALLVGIVINILQSKGPFGSVYPFLIPMLVQSFVRAGVRYKNRHAEILLQLPGERKDPAFVMDKGGQIITSAGITASYFKVNNIHSIFDIFDENDVTEIFDAVDDTQDEIHAESLELYSSLAKKWYLVQVKAVSGKSQVLVWLQDITESKMLDLSLSVIRRFSEEIIGSINDLVDENDIYDRLCGLIFQEGYEAVFITREDPEGNLSGHVCKTENDQLCLSEPIIVSKSSEAPVRGSRRTQRIVTAARAESESQRDFEKRHPFDDRVKAFLDSPIVNYVNYHEGDLSIIAFNKAEGIIDYDISVMETVVNTARSVTQLIDLAVSNDEKFLQIITGLCAAAEYSDELTGKHILRVNEYAKLLATNMDCNARFIDQIGQVAALHDIGKVAIPDIIKLERPLELTETREMYMHTVYGAQIVDKMIVLSTQSDQRLEMARDIALHHHQRWDGKGYPGLVDVGGNISKPLSKQYEDYKDLRPLKGKDIPLEALIVSLADKYDALRSARSYKPALTHDQTCALLMEDDRSDSTGEDIFGSELTALFLEIQKEFERIYENMQD